MFSIVIINLLKYRSCSLSHLYQPLPLSLSLSLFPLIAVFPANRKTRKVRLTFLLKTQSWTEGNPLWSLSLMMITDPLWPECDETMRTVWQQHGQQHTHSHTHTPGPFCHIIIKLEWVTVNNRVEIRERREGMRTGKRNSLLYGEISHYFNILHENRKLGGGVSTGLTAPVVIQLNNLDQYYSERRPKDSLHPQRELVFCCPALRRGHGQPVQRPLETFKDASPQKPWKEFTVRSESHSVHLLTDFRCL